MTPSAEDLLRARLHEVDDLQPPDNGFELDALRGGRERLKRRQSWTRGLVAAAAAVAVGVVAVPALTRSPMGASSSSGVAGAASPQRAEAAAPDSSAGASTGVPAYTAAQCQATLARIAADRDTLTRQGYAVGSLTCDGDGRVELPITNLVTAEQLQVLKVRYGDPVTVVQGLGVPATP